LSEQRRESLRHGQANLRTLQFSGGARCKHRAFYFLDQRGDPLAKWRPKFSDVPRPGLRFACLASTIEPRRPSFCSEDRQGRVQ
jgi:hypothetical protein